MKNTFSLKKALSFDCKAIWNNLGCVFAIFVISLISLLPVYAGMFAFLTYYDISHSEFSGLITSGMTFFGMISYLGWFSVATLLGIAFAALLVPGFYKVALNAYDNGRCSYKTVFTQFHHALSVGVFCFLPPLAAAMTTQAYMGFPIGSWQYAAVLICFETIWFWLYGAVPFLLVENKISFVNVLFNRHWRKTLPSLTSFNWFLLGLLSACWHACAPMFYFVIIFAQAYAYRQLYRNKD